MTMQKEIGMIAGLAAMLAAFAGIAGYGWLKEHDARLQAESQAGQQQKQIDSLRQQQQTTQQALDSRLAMLDKLRQRPATAAQLVSDTASLLPQLPEPLRIESVPDDPASPAGAATPAVVIPQTDFKSIRDAQLTCEENTAKLDACQSLQSDNQQQLKLTEAQRDEWKTAAKGGSMWHRALGAAKWFSVGVGAGAVAYAVAHHK
jgi:uncharacterized protein HemX